VGHNGIIRKHVNTNTKNIKEKFIMITVSYNYTIEIEEESRVLLLNAIRAYSPEVADKLEAVFKEQENDETKNLKSSYTMTMSVKSNLLEKVSNLAVGLKPVIDLITNGSFSDSELMKDIGMSVTEIHGDIERTTVINPIATNENTNNVDVEQKYTH